jgi:hypothetical protein
VNDERVFGIFKGGMHALDFVQMTLHSRLVYLFMSARAIFSYLAAVTITGDRAANLDLC